MAGKLVKVSDGFDAYLVNIQRQVKSDCGVKLSRKTISSIIAAQRPTIKIEMNGKKRKTGSIFDF